MPSKPFVPKRAAPIAAMAAAFALAGCAQYASVSEERPRFLPVRMLGAAQEGIVAGLRQERRKPLLALGEYLTATKTAAKQLQRAPRDRGAREAYNFALARVFSTIKEAKLDPWKQPLRVPTAEGEFLLTHQPDPRPNWNPALYDFTPSDQFDIKGKYVTERTLKEGLGAPLVAVGRDLYKDADADFTIPRIYYGVTGLARFEGGRCVLSFADPLATENVRFGGATHPLAANFTVPIAVMLASHNPKKMELTRLLRPEKYAETARIARIQPFDPNKTVVLVIHGLKDSPATWAPMLNHLQGDEAIRRNYQFWFYSYPSGYPYPYSASILRRELDAIQGRFALRKPMVVLGHSMGGCISRLLITDTGDRLWRALFKRPPAQMQMSPESRTLLGEALIFKHRPEVGRVVFISSPLKGSDMASNWMGRIGSSLVKAPATLLSVGQDALKFTTYQADDLKLKRIPNSVDTLAPNNRFVKAINTIPITPGIPYHVISGDRGKGGNKDKTKPVMSDGVVPYWSSHMNSAQSELVVPSDHGAHQHPLAFAEVARILELHARP